jgi:DNA-binding MurR/RpiR family transcriptional regulator
VGASGFAAHDLAVQLQRIGLSCFYSSDTHQQLTLASMIQPGGVAVGFSFGGNTAEIYEALALARRRGALAVAVTRDPASPVGASAEVVLTTAVRESSFRVGALASRIAQMAVVDFIFVRVVQLSESRVREAVEVSKDAVKFLKLD